MPQSALQNQNGFAMTLVLMGVLVLLVAGSLYYFGTKQSSNTQTTQTPSASVTQVPNSLPSSSPTSSLTISTSNIDTQQLKSDILSAVDQKIATLSGTKTNAPKEIYVNFGVNGSTQALDWMDLAGTDLMFNTGNYPGATGFYFQSDLQSDAPDRTAYARVYNVTNSLGVPGSDINFVGLTPTFEQSEAMSLPSGNLQLRVQIHSELNLTTIFNPRIRITY